MIQIPPFSEYFSETYVYFWFAPDDMKDMRMHNTKCKHTPRFHTNISLTQKSEVKVVNHSRHSNLEMKLIIRTRINSICITSKHKNIQHYGLKSTASQICSSKSHFCEFQHLINYGEQIISSGTP